MRVSLLLAASVSALTLSSIARAQGAEGDTEAAPPRAPAEPKEEIVVPSSSTGERTTVIVVTEDPAKPKDKPKPGPIADKPQAEDDDGGARFRGGVSGTIGAFIPGPIVQFGVEGRLGAQINDLYAVYADFGAQAGLGSGIGDGGTSASIGFGAAIFASALFEVTLADVWFIGAGPSLMYGAFGTFDLSTENSAVGEELSLFLGGLPGLKVRTGVGFGSDRPNRRKQFTLALQANIVFGQRYRSDGLVGFTDNESIGIGVGVIPMLALGYDAK